jgi:hypothetical protein
MENTETPFDITYISVIINRRESIGKIIRRTVQGIIIVKKLLALKNIISLIFPYPAETSYFKVSSISPLNPT